MCLATHTYYNSVNKQPICMSSVNKKYTLLVHTKLQVLKSAIFCKGQNALPFSALDGFVYIGSFHICWFGDGQNIL